MLNSVELRTLHEAAHAVAAWKAKMRDIEAVLVESISDRGVPTNGNTTYSYWQENGETEADVHKRRLFVTIAGPAWEAFLAGESSCMPAMNRERDDRRAIRGIVRDLLSCGLVGEDLKDALKSAWNAASILPLEMNERIMRVSRHLELHRRLGDSELRELLDDN